MAAEGRVLPLPHSVGVRALKPTPSWRGPSRRWGRKRRARIIGDSREQAAGPCFLFVGEIWDKMRSFHFLFPWLNDQECVGKEDASVWAGSPDLPFREGAAGMQGRHFETRLSNNSPIPWYFPCWHKGQEATRGHRERLVRARAASAKPKLKHVNTAQVCVGPHFLHQPLALLKLRGGLCLCFTRPTPLVRYFLKLTST